MARKRKNLNSDGRVIIAGHTDGIVSSITGLTLTIHSPFGNLSFDIPNPKENYGCLPETSYLTLRLPKDGNISVRMGLH